MMFWLVMILFGIFFVYGVYISIRDAWEFEWKEIGLGFLVYFGAWVVILIVGTVIFFVVKYLGSWGLRLIIKLLGLILVWLESW